MPFVLARAGYSGKGTLSVSWSTEQHDSDDQNSDIALEPARYWTTRLTLQLHTTRHALDRIAKACLFVPVVHCCRTSQRPAHWSAIERPKLRNEGSIDDLNTLIHVVINLRGLQFIRWRRSKIAC